MTQYLIKATYGSEVGSKLIIDKRRMGWKTDIIDTHSLPKRLICKKIIADMGVLSSDYHSVDLGKVTLDKTKLYEALTNIMSMSKDGIVRKYAGIILGTSIDHVLDELNDATPSYGLRLWIAYFLGSLNMTKDLDDLIMSSFKKDSWPIIPSMNEMIGYMLVNSLITQLFTKSDVAIKDLLDKIDTSRVSNVDLRTIANRMWLVWRDTSAQINKLKTELVNTGSHFEALMAKMINQGPEFIPTDLSQDQCAQMRAFGNVWEEAIFTGLSPAIDTPNENWAWQFYSIMSSEITAKDSWLEVVSTKDFVTTVLEAEDHVGRYIHGEFAGQNYIHRHFKPRVPEYSYDSFQVTPYDAKKGLVTLERTSGLGPKVTEIMNDLRSIVDAKKFIDATLPLSEGLIAQQDIVNHDSGDATDTIYGEVMNKAINLALLMGSYDIDFEPGREPIFLVDVPAELSKLVAGVETTEEGIQEIDNPEDALAIVFNNDNRNPSSLVKHVHPYYNGKDEDSSKFSSILWKDEELQPSTSFVGLQLKSCFSDKEKKYDGSLAEVLKVGDVTDRLTKNPYITEDLLREMKRTSSFVSLSDLGVVFAQKLLSSILKSAHNYTHRWVSFKIQKKAGFMRRAMPSTPAALVTMAENELAAYVTLICVVDSQVGAALRDLINQVLALVPLATVNIGKINKG